MTPTIAFDVYGTLINTKSVERTLGLLVGQKSVAVSELWRQKQLEYSFRRGLMREYRDFSVCTHDALLFADAYDTGDAAYIAEAVSIVARAEMPMEATEVLLVPTKTKKLHGNGC